MGTQLKDKNGNSLFPKVKITDIENESGTIVKPSVVSVASSGTSTDEVSYITIDGVEKKLAGGGSGGSSFIEVSELPTENINTSAIYKVIKPDSTSYTESVVLGFNAGDQTIDKVTTYSEEIYTLMETIQNFIAEKFPDMSEEEVEIAGSCLLYTCIPMSLNIEDSLIIKCGYDASISKFIWYFYARMETEVVYEKQFDTMQEFEAFYATDEYQTCLEEINGEELPFNFYETVLASDKLNFKITESRDISSYLNFIASPISISNPNKCYIYNKQQWVEINGLPLTSSLGNFLYYNGSNWADLSGYGYTTDSVIETGWGGDTTGLESFDLTGVTIYKVSDTPIDRDIITRGYQLSVFGYTDDESSEPIEFENQALEEIFTNFFYQDYENSSSEVRWVVINVLVDTYIDPRTIKKGLWLSKVTLDNVTYYPEISWTSKVVKIDSKFIPSDSAKQDKLVSGTNIKTINNQSILGSGNISISSSSIAWGKIIGTLSNQADLNTALNNKSKVSASSTGSSTNEIKYVTIDGTEYKIVDTQGTIVTANPTYTGSNKLTTITIGDDSYKIEGIVVVANPEYSGENKLNTITIGDDSYKIDSTTVLHFLEEGD